MCRFCFNRGWGWVNVFPSHGFLEESSTNPWLFIVDKNKSEAHGFFPFWVWVSFSTKWRSPKSWGYPQIIQVMNDHDFVLKPFQKPMFFLVIFHAFSTPQIINH